MRANSRRDNTINHEHAQRSERSYFEALQCYVNLPFSSENFSEGLRGNIPLLSHVGAALTQFFPDGQPVEFGANPFRAGSAAASRYNVFSVATSLGQARARGARSADISRAVAKGAARLT